MLGRYMHVSRETQVRWIPLLSSCVPTREERIQTRDNMYSGDEIAGLFMK